MTQKIEISHRSIIFTVFFLLGLWLLFQIREIIVAVFVSIIFMSALNPIVSRLEKSKFPRVGAILLIYIILLTLMGTILAIILPPLLEQTSSMISHLPLLLKNVNYLGFIDAEIISTQISQLGSIPANILRLTVSVFSNVIQVFAILIITFYLLLERENLKKYLMILFGEGKEEVAENFVDRVEKRLGGWVRGEAVLMTIIGIMTYIGLRFLGIDYALPLAILGGFLELIPNMGPIISAIPAIIAGIAINPVVGVAVTALYILIHQSENSFIAPKIMQKVVGVNPLVTILSLATGFKIGGVIGAILAIPLVLVFQEVITEVISSRSFKKL